MCASQYHFIDISGESQDGEAKGKANGKVNGRGNGKADVRWRSEKSVL